MWTSPQHVKIPFRCYAMTLLFSSGIYQLHHPSARWIFLNDRSASLVLLTHVSVFVFCVCSSCLNLLFMERGGGAHARLADGPIFQMYWAAPKGASQNSIPYHWHYGTVGEKEEGVHNQTKSSLAFLLFVSSDQ